MSKEKSREVEVNVDGKKTKIIVKKPSGSISSRGTRLAAKVWNECVADGIMTKQELKEFMNKRGIWSEEKDKSEENLSNEIAELERKLAFGSGKGGRIKASAGKAIAIEIREKRIELRDLISERLSLEGNTAEALSENAKFDLLVASCTYNENGEKVYNSLEDYDQNSDDEIAFAAASAMAQMLYSLDKNFELSLPENQFLKKHHFTNDDGSLVNDKGELIDLDGRRINEFGHFLNDKGERVDKDGHLLDDAGRYITTVQYVDETPKKKQTTAKKTDS